jgi:L-ascorbate metabolism protein UlaG (beta-lactamase superfamily)
MKLQYFGHSFWKVETPEVAIVIDPFDNIGYPLPKDIISDYVFISHEHHDHNNTSLVKGNPVIVRKPGFHELKNLKAELIQVFHDEEHGSQRGRNNIIKLQLEGLTVVHCGDLGHLPSEDVRKKFSHPDILMIPVGEVYTLSIDEARTLIDSIQPKLVFPMHYYTPVLSFRLGRLENFLKESDDVYYHTSSILEISEVLLSSPRYVIMKWES